MVDLFETKIDDFFPEAMFMVDNFSILKSNRNQHRGDALSYVRSYLTGEWKKKQVLKDLESVGIELTSGEQKCFLQLHF